MSDKNESQQDNTFIRQDYEPLKDIVRRNQQHNARLHMEGVKKKMDMNADRAAYEPLKPTYEPIQDTKESLRNMTRPDVFARGRMHKSGPYPKAPYKKNDNK